MSPCVALAESQGLATDERHIYGPEENKKQPCGNRLELEV